MPAITDLSALTAIASGDLFVVHDISAATDKKITQSDLLGSSGNWTPVLAFGGASTGITYGTQTGIYNRVGNIVYISARMSLTSKGSATGIATVTGLPFAVSGLISLLNFYAYALATSVSSTSAIILSGTTITLYFTVAGGATGAGTVTDTIIGNTSDLLISGTYRTA